MNITRFDLQDKVSVSCEIGEIPIDGTYSSIGYFKAFGEYKAGSTGTKDAKHIYGMMAYAKKRYRHREWLVDFTELSYVWGDDFVLLEDKGGMEYVDNCAMVVGPKCMEAISTLSGMDAKPTDCLKHKNTFDNMQDAFEYLLKDMDLNYQT